MKEREIRRFRFGRVQIVIVAFMELLGVKWMMYPGSKIHTMFEPFLSVDVSIFIIGITINIDIPKGERL